MGVGLVRTLAGRSLLRRPGRTLFSVCGIAVGIATVVGIFTLDHNTVLGRAQQAQAEWQADVRVSPSDLAKRPREELEALPGIEGIAATFQNDAGLVLPDDPQARAERVRLIAIDPAEARALGAYFVSEGADLSAEPTAGDPEVLIGDALARRLELGVGDTVLLGQPRRPPRKDCVDGEWQVRQGKRRDEAATTAFRVVGVMGRDGLGRRSRGEVVVVPFEAGRALFEGAPLKTEYWLKYAPDFNLEKLQSSLGRAYSYELDKSVIVGQAADERAFRNGVRFAGLLAMVLGLFVIFHTLSMSLLERVREVAALHALGATRAQVAKIFLAEAVVIAGLGGVLGLAGGLVMAKVLLRAGVTTVGVGYPIHLFDVPWLQAGPLTLVGVLIALAGSVFPLLRARHASVARALRGQEEPQRGGVARGFQIFAAVLLAGVLPGMYFVIVPVIGDAQAELVGVIMVGVGILALFVTLPLIVPSVLGFVCARIAHPFERRWPLAGKLAASSIQQNPARVAGAVAAIALVTAGFVGLRGMTRSLEAEIDVWGREAFLRKVYLRNLPKTNFDELSAALREYPGIVGLEPGDARAYLPFLLIGLDVDQLAGWGPLAEDPALVEKLRDGGAIVSRRLANHNGYEPGSQLHVSTGRGQVESLSVLAVSDAYGYFPHPDERLYAVVSDEFLGHEFCIDTDFVTSASVRLAEDAPYEVVKTAVADFLPNAKGISFETGPYLFRWHSTDIRRDFVLFDIILALTALLAGLGILNGQLLAALERSKELGVLKALGMTRRQVAGTVLLEAAVVGVVGGGMGLVVGAGLSPVIVRALETISALPLPTRSAGWWMPAAWVGAVAVASAACAYPIWRINHMSAVAAVRMGG